MRKLPCKSFMGLLIALAVLLATPACCESKAKTVAWNQKKEYTITQGVTEIPENVFDQCKAKTVSIPKSVKKLDGHGSLVGKGVKKLIIPKSVKKLETGGIGTVPVNTVVYVPKKEIKSYMKCF